VLRCLDKVDSPVDVSASGPRRPSMNSLRGALMERFSGMFSHSLEDGPGLWPFLLNDLSTPRTHGERRYGGIAGANLRRRTNSTVSRSLHAGHIVKIATWRTRHVRTILPARLAGPGSGLEPKPVGWDENGSSRSTFSSACWLKLNVTGRGRSRRSPVNAASASKQIPLRPRSVLHRRLHIEVAADSDRIGWRTETGRG
jgi:hypothetical protein